jgi:hypothetical protein
MEMMNGHPHLKLDQAVIILDDTNDRLEVDFPNGDTLVLDNFTSAIERYKMQLIVGSLETTPPPKAAEKFLYFLLPRRVRENIPGDLEEEYRTIILPKFGPGYAKRWYWMQVVNSLVPILWGQLIRLIRFGVFAKIADWLLERLSS